MLGQFIQNIYLLWVLSTDVGNPTGDNDLPGLTADGFGVFDNIARYTGAGTAVPVTGFANLDDSAARNLKKRAWYWDRLENVALAGSVIV